VDDEVLVRLHPHAVDRLHERGATEEEVALTVRRGTRSPARLGRTHFSLEHPGEGLWQGRPYRARVIEVYAVPDDGWLVITVIVKFDRRRTG
jgi:hypothetical protein